jgi:hypothetical protein
MPQQTERYHRCDGCQRDVAEKDGTWPCDPDFVGDHGPEGFSCFECLEREDITFDTLWGSGKAHRPELTSTDLIEEMYDSWD